MGLLEAIARAFGFVRVTENPAFTVQKEPIGVAPLDQPEASIKVDLPITESVTPEPVYCAVPPVTGLLGDTVAKYESGNKGYTAISNTPGDPGGPSYGKYQLATNTGNVTAFLKFSGYENRFTGLKPGSDAFNKKWIACCSETAFCKAQHSYIEQRLYQPVRAKANALKLPSTPAIDEALWSMAVQHGKAALIVEKAAGMGITDERSVVHALYRARRVYVQSLTTLTTSITNAILNRYVREELDVLKLIGASK